MSDILRVAAIQKLYIGGAKFYRVIIIKGMYGIGWVSKGLKRKFRTRTEAERYGSRIELRWDQLHRS